MVRSNCERDILLSISPTEACVSNSQTTTASKTLGGHNSRRDWSVPGCSAINWLEDPLKESGARVFRALKPPAARYRGLLCSFVKNVCE
jgi:hypothetical protein